MRIIALIASYSIQGKKQRVLPQGKALFSLQKNSVFSKKVLILNPYPQTPFPGKGAECGAAALTPLGATPQTPFFKIM